MAAKHLEATSRAAEWFNERKNSFAQKDLYALRLVAANKFGISIATLNRAIKRLSK